MNYDISNNKELIKDILENTSERTKEIIKHLFGLDNYEKLNYTQLADKFQLSKERIRQIAFKFFRQAGCYNNFKKAGFADDKLNIDILFHKLKSHQQKLSKEHIFWQSQTIRARGYCLLRHGFVKTDFLQR